jgi:threonine aldolase
MAAAEVGDDVLGDDPTVHELESRAAAVLGKEAGLFVPSGTQSNLCALLAHCERGDEYIAGERAHTYRYEGGGAAVLGGISPQPVRTDPDGMPDLDHVSEVVKPIDDHFARTRLLCLENSHDGRVQTLAQMRAARHAADRHGLALHLDGARLWNASVALGVEPAAVAEPSDSVSVCLSKGLGAPVGSVLAGSRDLIDRARRWRKVLGGAMRQSGIVAAAGIHALDNNVGRLAEDHHNAESLAAGIDTIDGLTVTSRGTNMVFARFEGGEAAATSAEERLERAGILIRTSGDTTRLVTHLDVDSVAVERLLEALTRVA